MPPPPRRRPPGPAPQPKPRVAEEFVSTPSELDAFLDHLSGAAVVGLDTEFVGEESYRPELCLVQVATPERLALIDPYSAGDLGAFWRMLCDPARTTVVHAGREEVRMCRFAIGEAPARVFDLQVAAALVGFNYPIGYGGLVQEALGVRANKSETLTDWRRRPLSAGQVRYAYDDVRYLLELHQLLNDKLVRLRRTGWGDEEFATAVRRAVADDPAVEKWRKLKGLGGLNRRELAIARELFYWREGLAARVNRPPRVLLRDDILVELAKRGLDRPDDAGQLRGVPRGEATAILAAVERGASLPAAECPDAAERENDPPHVSTLTSLMAVVLAEYCARHQLAANLVATMADLKTLVRSRQAGARPDEGAPSGLARGWRAANVRPHLEAVLDGNHVIRVSDPKSANPITVHPIAGKS